ncbi:EamA family transporter [Paenibacillus sp. GSMTC-2017]|uniref:DMT family transporter n=1 Tax=Paenibacillus sp. GSMTC-2017 TaxID=2794350 RepID=UPI0018D87471|nr:EamA family transporter [Paenibacillus sp. GSMTC-2017]MBH5320072.1 EamA family transporter [Paenibacillus sp. GSMTC-2017]
MILLAYVLICLIFGTTFLAIKVGVDAGAPPFFSAGLRFFLAGAILFLWMVWRRKASFSLLLRKEMLFTGATLTFGTFSTLYWAEQYVSSGLAAVLSSTGPIMILLLQTIFLRQKAPLHSLFGVIIGFIGVLLLVLPSQSADVTALWIIGCIAILIGKCCYAAGAIYSKKAMNSMSEISPIAMNAAQMMYGGAILLILSLFTEDVHLDYLLSFQSAGSLIYLIVIGSMIGHTLFYWLVSKTNPIFPATWLYVSPPIAVGIGILFYHESVTWVTMIGVITILTGTVLVNVSALKMVIRKR